MNSTKYLWLDGEFVPWAEGKIHVHTDAVLWGANVFEGLRGYWNEERQEMYVFRLADHLARLRDSMKMMFMSCPYSLDAIHSAALALVRKNGFREDIHCRITAYFGSAQVGAAPTEIPVGVFIQGGALPSKPHLKTGISCCVSSWTRISDRNSPPRIKAGANYQNSRLAHFHARNDGYDTAILLNEWGKVSEAPTACIFAVRDGTAFTPSVTSGILESITRATLIELFRNELGVPVFERDIDRTELYIADEVFLCGTGMEITPVISVDRHQVRDGVPGSITKRIQTAYFDLVRGCNQRYSSWLTSVYAR